MKIAVVTGASSGMGKWFAVYATYYYPDIEEIWLLGRNMKKLHKVARQINVSTKCIPVDLTSEDDIRYIELMLHKEKPEIELLVNSAGIGVIGRFDVASRQDADTMVNLNCKALTDICYLCIPYMTKESHLLNMASAAAFVCQSEFAVYAATKSYVLSFSDGLGKELKKNGIYVTAVCPGCVKTPFFKEAQKYQKVKTFKKLFMANDRAVVHKAYWDSKWKCRRSIFGFTMKLFYIICKLLPLGILLLFV